MKDLAVLVPVLNRPQNVRPLVDSWAASDTPGTLWFIMTASDVEEIDAYMALPFVQWRDDLVGFAQVTDVSWPRKINAAWEMLEPENFEWFLCGADDIRFVPGWWDATKEYRDDPAVGVIGTNDSRHGAGNPRVAAGEHTCHPLVRSSYVRDFGTIDHPGLVVHPDYRHWCVDDELIWTAKKRGAWAFCREAVIEHLHPYWGLAQWDATYALGEADAEVDMALWKQRAKLLQ